MNAAHTRKRIAKVKRVREIEEKRARQLLAELALKRTKIEQLQSEIEQINSDTSRAVVGPTGETATNAALQSLHNSQRLVTLLTQKVAKEQAEQRQAVEEYLSKNKAIEGWERLEAKLNSLLQTQYDRQANNEATDRFLLTRSQGLDQSTSSLDGTRK